MRRAVKRYITIAHATGEAPVGAHLNTFLDGDAMLEVVRIKEDLGHGLSTFCFRRRIPDPELREDIEASELFERLREPLDDGWKVKRAGCSRVKYRRDDETKTIYF